MFKFVKREHYKKGDHHKKIVITYSLSEIIMGFLLVVLVAFFIYNYLDINLFSKNPAAPGIGMQSQPFMPAASTTPTKKTK